MLPWPFVFLYVYMSDEHVIRYMHGSSQLIQDLAGMMLFTPSQSTVPSLPHVTGPFIPYLQL